MRRPIMRRALWMGMRRSLRSTKTTKATTAAIPATRKSTTTRLSDPQASFWTFWIRSTHAAGQAGHNAGEDEQAHAVADAAVGNLLAEPHDERGSGCKGRRRLSAMKLAPGVKHQAALGEHDGDANGLQRAQDHGHVTGPLGNLAAAQLAFLLDARQRLIYHGQ